MIHIIKNYKWVIASSLVCIIFGLLTFCIGQPLLFFKQELGFTVLLGMLVPTVMSYINIEVIEYLSKTRGNLITFGFNMVQFLTKTIFMCMMTYIGISVLELNATLYISLLCTTWFTFHVLEAFFTQQIIMNKITEMG